MSDLPHSAEAGDDPAPGAPRARRWPFAAILAALVVHAIAGPFPARPLAMGIVLVAGGLAWAVALRDAACGAWGLRAVVLGAVALRVAAAFTGPVLSDDVHRYVWEGELVRRGSSPYAHAPADPERAELRAELPVVYARMNHPEVPAAYPPATQLALGAIVAADRSLGRSGIDAVDAMRAAFSLLDLLVLVPLVALLRRRGRPVGLALAWGWSPLVALEFAGSGHFDSLGILLWLSAFVLLAGERVRLGAAFLSASILVKFLPLVALPALLRRPRRRRQLVLTGALVGAAFLGFALALEGGARGFFRGLGIYGSSWEGGSLVFRWIDAGLRATGAPFGLHAGAVARVLVGAAFVAVVARGVRRRVEPLRASGAAVVAFLVLSPTLHPWYVTWAVPFAVLAPRVRLTPVVLAIVAPLLYGALARRWSTGVWEEPAWVWPLVALPTLAALAVDARRDR